MAHNTLIGGTIGKITEGKDLIGGTAYSRKYGKPLVGGTTYKIGLGGGGGTVGNLTVGNLAVGSSVYVKRAGVSIEFIVVHQGLPDANLYDASCDGTWLLMKNILSTSQIWDSTDNDYANSDVKKMLDSEYIYFDIYSSIKQVKLPYQKGTGSGGSVSSGANGLSARLFLLSAQEVGSVGVTSNAPIDGTCLDYFKGGWTTLKAYYNGNLTDWYLRSPFTTNTASICKIYSSMGFISAHSCSIAGGLRYAFILPKDMMYDENFNVIP